MDALGQRVRDRFNEDFSEVQGEQQKPGAVGLHHRNLKQLKQSHGKGGPNSYASSRPGSDIFSKNKRRSTCGVSNTSELAMVMSSKDAARLAAAAEVTSVVTVDRLKKFNEIQGTTAGNVIDELAAAQ